MYNNERPKLGENEPLCALPSKKETQYCWLQDLIQFNCRSFVDKKGTSFVLFYNFILNYNNTKNINNFVVKIYNSEVYYFTTSIVLEL